MCLLSAGFCSGSGAGSIKYIPRIYFDPSDQDYDATRFRVCCNSLCVYHQMLSIAAVSVSDTTGLRNDKSQGARSDDEHCWLALWRAAHHARAAVRHDVTREGSKKNEGNWCCHIHSSYVSVQIFVPSDIVSRNVPYTLPNIVEKCALL